MAATNSGDSKFEVTGFPAAQPSRPAAHPYPAAQPYLTAYPYAPAHPFPAYNYVSAQPNSYRFQPSSFIRRLIAAFIAVCTVVGALILILWLVFRPHLPRFSLVSASISSFNITDSQLTATWDLTFRVDNPNEKMAISYEHVRASVFRDGDVLAQTFVPPFQQGKRYSTTLRARLAAVSEYTGRGSGLDIAAERRKGQVKFDVRLVSFVQFRAGGWRTRRRYMMILCGDARFGFAAASSSASLLGGRKECKVVL